MKAEKRDIITIIMIALTTLVAIGFFMGNLKEKKTIIQTDLFNLVAPSPHAILTINQPKAFANYMLSLPEEYALFASSIPTIYLDILQNHPTLTSAQLSFHPDGIIFYAQADEKQVTQITKETLQKKFHAFAPETLTNDGQTYTFYPATENRFFGCSHSHGIWIASYSKKLLEEVTHRQTNPKKQHLTEQRHLLKTLDRHAPLNILLPADSLNLYVSMNDSTDWRIQDCWLGADLFTNENHLCYSGCIPHYPVADSLYTQLGDTLVLRLQQKFPMIQLSNQTSFEEESVFYNGCLIPSTDSLK